MRTDDLIAALARDARPEPPPGRQLLLALLAVAVVPLAIYASMMGPRETLADTWWQPRFLLKLGLALLLAVSAAGTLLRLASPERRSGGWALALLAVPVLLALGVGVELLVVPATDWRARAVGQNSTWCLRLIPLLALAPLAANLWVLKRAAPTRPAIAGAAAGLLAGGLGAALYATHCPDDSPLFVACWYGLAIAATTAIGAVAGSRVLRW